MLGGVESGLFFYKCLTLSLTVIWTKDNEQTQSRNITDLHMEGLTLGFTSCIKTYFALFESNNLGNSSCSIFTVVNSALVPRYLRCKQLFNEEKEKKIGKNYAEKRYLFPCVFGAVTPPTQLGLSKHGRV